jgi:uncharacterized protein YndB with AHSA1/START domain
VTFDLAAHLSALTRAVKNLERDGKPAKAVVMSCVYDTDIDDLWQAISTRDRLKRWFGAVSGDLELGGRFKIEGNAEGIILECVPRERIATTWEFGGGVSWVTARLTSEPAGTRLEVEHLAPIDAHWVKYGPGAAGIGWDLWLMGLGRHLDAPDFLLKPEEAEAWFFTDEARQMIRTSSEDWARADIAAGADEAQARAVAESTRRFYSGEPPMES